MKQLTLDVTKRELSTNGAVKGMRREGKIPAVLYGKKIVPMHIVVGEKDLEKITSTHAGFNVILNLNFGKGEPTMALIRDYQAHPLKRTFTHVDFQAIDAKDKIVVEIPIELKGLAIGVKDGGGMLEQMLRKVEVKCLPTNIPESIELDVSGLDIGDGIHIHEVKLPDGVELAKELDYAVCTVVAPTKEEVVAPVDGAEGEVKEGAVVAEGDKKEGEAGKSEEKKEGDAKPQGGAKEKKGKESK